MDKVQILNDSKRNRESSKSAELYHYTAFTKPKNRPTGCDGTLALREYSNELGLEPRSYGRLP